MKTQTSTPPTPDLDEARRLFIVYIGDRCNINSLYGPVKASCRAHILSAMRGERVPQSKAGWNAFREAMLELFGIDNSWDHSMAAKDVMLQDAAMNHKRSIAETK